MDTPLTWDEEREIERQAFEYANRYRFILSEFTGKQICFGCLANSIMLMLSEGKEITIETVMQGYECVRELDEENE